MKCRKKVYSSLLVCALLIGFPINTLKAQYMPVVFDRTYGENIEYQHLCPVANGEAVLVGTNNDRTTVTWVKREGDARFSRLLPSGFISVNNVYNIENNQILIIGQSNVKSKGKKSVEVAGRALVIDANGDISIDAYLGNEGSELLCGKRLKDGSFILGGYEPTPLNVRAGMLVKLDASGKIVYKYIASESGPCVAFDILGSSTEFVHAAFTSSNGGNASLTRLDKNGKPLFVTVLPEVGFQINKMVTSQDGNTFLAGNSDTGGKVLKIRSEGDIVFNKEIVPASLFSKLEHLYLANNGNILVGGNGDDRSYYSLLRNDGTDLQKYVMKESITGMGIDALSGESVIVGFDRNRGRGTIIGLAKDGRQIYQKATDGDFDKTQLNPNGIFLASTSSGRICMVSNMGELLFDRYAIEDSKSSFDDISFTLNGDILLKDLDNRLIKLGHGVYVSDVKINKPVNGYTTALFTVTLTGYPTTDQGVPMPVTVEYFTKEGTASEANNYSPIKGSLSFVPSNDGAAKYMIKQEVEVPIKANNLVEGRKFFEMNLSNVSKSYLVKPKGTATIEDQEVIIKLVNTVDGLEAERDVVYELGLFKTNGEALVNATGSDVIIEGNYGKGTADALDFDMGITPRTVIANGSKTGKFNVKTLSDTRYELPKTVIVDFNKVYATSDANVSFESSLLSCSGTIIDQPAMLAITSLGDHGRMNNIVSGFFCISLLRASDGALLTNATGGDITISSSVSTETTAEEGKDFVFTNLHDLRIWGDGNRSAINLNGIILFDKDKLGAKKLVVGIDSVTTPTNSPKINISQEGKYAGFTINE